MSQSDEPSIEKMEDCESKS